MLSDNLGADCTIAWIRSAKENNRVITAFLKALKQATVATAKQFQQFSTSSIKLVKFNKMISAV